MKLNPDCVRDVLAELESFPLGQYHVGSFCKSIAKHGEEDVRYSLTKLAEAKYINAEYLHTMDGRIHIGCIYDLTFAGHEFLSSVRSPDIWERIKDAASDGGTACFKVIGEVGADLLKAAIMQKLGLQ